MSNHSGVTWRQFIVKSAIGGATLIASGIAPLAGHSQAPVAEPAGRGAFFKAGVPILDFPHPERRIQILFQNCTLFIRGHQQ